MIYPPNIQNFNKISQLQNQQKYIINHQPSPMELSDLTNSENKTQSDLTTQLKLIQHLQLLHIFAES